MLNVLLILLVTKGKMLIGLLFDVFAQYTVLPTASWQLKYNQNSIFTNNSINFYSTKFSSNDTLHWAQRPTLSNTRLTLSEGVRYQ